MSEGKARRLILANGYKLQTERDGYVCVLERRGKVNHVWQSTSWRDLAASFKLHERKAGT